MATANRSFTIFLGTPTPITTTITLVDAGSSGDGKALRVLTHPDSGIADLPYAENPDRTLNIDNDLLLGATARVVRTETSSKVLRWNDLPVDTVITELWIGTDQNASMLTAFFRQLYEYYLNPPAYSPTAQTYITWAPRDRSGSVYNVDLFDFFAGSGGDLTRFDVKDVRGVGGGEIAGDLEQLLTVPSGLVDRSVTLRMKIVSEV